MNAATKSSTPGPSRSRACFVFGVALVIILGPACHEHPIGHFDDTVQLVGVSQSVTNPAPTPVDLLLVVDNSLSMCEEQAAVAERLQDLVRGLHAGGVALRVGVVTTDMIQPLEAGLMRRAPGTGACGDTAACPLFEAPWLTLGPDLSAGSPDADSIIQAISCRALVGTNGEGHEMGLSAAVRALDKQPGFHRDNALLAVVFVSDEDDCSDGTLPGAPGPLNPINPDACQEQGELLTPAPALFKEIQERTDRSEALFVGMLAVPSGASTSGEACDLAPTVRYEDFAQQLPLRQRWSAPICHVADPTLLDDSLRQLQGSLEQVVDGVCLEREPYTCTADSPADGDRCPPGERCCPAGQQCSVGPFASNRGAFLLCDGFTVTAVSRAASGQETVLQPEVDYVVDFGATECNDAWPIEVRLESPLTEGTTLRIDYATARPGQ